MGYPAAEMAIPLIERAGDFADRAALEGASGRLTYGELLDASARAARALLADRDDLEGRRVAFLAPADLGYATTQWAIWRAGGIAVPLCTLHPRPELEHVVDDAGASALVAAPELADRLRPIARARSLPLATTGELCGGPLPEALPEVGAGRRAMIVYTSGTTGKPKGAVTTHAQIAAQVESLVDAWAWSADDRVLLVLPLHHVHGIVNVLGCALWSGAICEMLPTFDAEAVWDRIAGGRLTLFMAVPTIYAKLIDSWEAASEDRRRRLSAGAGRVRLMVSGSAALPVSALDHVGVARLDGGDERAQERGFVLEGLAVEDVGARREVEEALPAPVVGERDDDDGVVRALGVREAALGHGLDVQLEAVQVVEGHPFEAGPAGLHQVLLRGIAHQVQFVRPALAAVGGALHVADGVPVRAPRAQDDDVPVGVRSGEGLELVALAREAAQQLGVGEEEEGIERLLLGRHGPAVRAAAVDAHARRAVEQRQHVDDALGGVFAEEREVGGRRGRRVGHAAVGVGEAGPFIPRAGGAVRRRRRTRPGRGANPDCAFGFLPDPVQGRLFEQGETVEIRRSVSEAGPPP